MKLTKNENVERRIYGKVQDVEKCANHLDFEAVITSVIKRISGVYPSARDAKREALYRLYHEKYGGDKIRMRDRAKRDLAHVQEQIREIAKYF